MRTKKGDEQGTPSGVTRRQFVKRAGMAVAGAAVSAPLLAACNSESQQVIPVTTSVPPTPVLVSGATATPVARSVMPTTWDYEADVVIIGSGAAGMPAAISARDAGASVIVVEQNYDVGGRAMASGSFIALGGNDALQQKEGTKTVFGGPDSPDILFRDLVDWSVVTEGGKGTYRFNDRELSRVAADSVVAVRDFLLANGVKFAELSGAHGQSGVSASRRAQTVHDEQGKASPFNPPGQTGVGLIRPLEESARKKGVQFLLSYLFDQLYREQPLSGPVVGIRAQYTPRLLPNSTTPMKPLRTEGNIDTTKPTVNIKAKKAVIIATNGPMGNKTLRKIWDVRWPEALQVTNAAWAGENGQSGLGHIAVAEIGGQAFAGIVASYETEAVMRKRNVIGTQHAYYQVDPESPIWPFARSSGIDIGTAGWPHVICVNQVGKRFYHEESRGYPTEAAYPPGRLTLPEKFTQWDWRNCDIDWMKQKYNKNCWTDASVMMNEGSTAPDYDAGGVWAIFDSAAVTRQKWDIKPPYTADDGYFFSANTLAELATKISSSPKSKVPMPPANLEETFRRWNSLVDKGEDEDFGKNKPFYKVDSPPFYAAWTSIMLHDTIGGIWINGKMQVKDVRGNIIPGLYAAGECAASTTQHGLGRCIPQGYNAGRNAAQESSRA